MFFFIETTSYEQRHRIESPLDLDRKKNRLDYKDYKEYITHNYKRGRMTHDRQTFLYHSHGIWTFLNLVPSLAIPNSIHSFSMVTYGSSGRTIPNNYQHLMDNHNHCIFAFFMESLHFQLPLIPCSP